MGIGITKAIDIKKTVISILKENFSYKIMASDVKDGFDKPSFFVYIPFFHASTETVTTNRKTYEVEIQLNNSSTNELLSVEEQLYELFSYTIKVNDRVFEIDNVESEIIDKNLYFNFVISFMEVINVEKERHEKIEKINIKYKEDK